MSTPISCCCSRSSRQGCGARGGELSGRLFEGPGAVARMRFPNPSRRAAARSRKKPSSRSGGAKPRRRALRSAGRVANEAPRRTCMAGEGRQRVVAPRAGARTRVRPERARRSTRARRPSESPRVRALVRGGFPFDFARQAAPGPAAPGVGLVPADVHRRAATAATRASTPKRRCSTPWRIWSTWRAACAATSRWSQAQPSSLQCLRSS